MNKLTMHTPNLADENFKKLAALFPNAVTETVNEDGVVVRAIDKDVLMQEISTTVVEGREERYQFTWPDKKKAVLAANAPISATLRPSKADSVGKDGTPGGWDSENLYIEGDNLDVLKLLRETYLGKVKMIYIDPPYNTGNDFVYEDDFADPERTALEGIKRMETFFASIGMPTTFSRINIPYSSFGEMANRATADGKNTVGNFVKLTRDDIYEIYHLAL